jgi:hypothetical protein
MWPQFSTTSTLHFVRKVAEDLIDASAAIVRFGLPVGVRDSLSQAISTPTYQSFSLPLELSSEQAICPTTRATKGGGRHLVLLQGGESGHLPACRAGDRSAAFGVQLRLAEYQGHREIAEPMGG